MPSITTMISWKKLNGSPVEPLPTGWQATDQKVGPRHSSSTFAHLLNMREDTLPEARTCHCPNLMMNWPAFPKTAPSLFIAKVGTALRLLPACCKNMAARKSMT